ncbi:MAG: trypsin-like peptidase domain-containing protein [Lachnospiraceae bacterium]|nr:trypsin-like peptidase domain-containing protein [Lachnospiraceae bacterium]
MVVDMDEMENRKQYVNMEQYNNAYLVGRKVKSKKQHPVLRQVLFRCLQGLLFGVFAGFGIYMILVFSGVTGRLAKVENVSQELEHVKKDILVEVERNQVAQDSEPIKIEGTKEETEIQQMETVTAVVSDVTEVVKSAMPCVVSITNFYTAMDWYGDESEEEASGSGIIVGENEDELLIVTNYHVIEENDQLSVQFIDDSEVIAYVKGTDSEHDLAVIAVLLVDIEEATKQRIAIATLGNSDALQVGEPAIAIGNSLGYGQSVTTGVISALNREIEFDDNTTSFLIQTDAAINPGNSGGALLNVKGEVIGINSSKIADYLIEGMGYAIPITTAKPIIEELMLRETRQKVAESEKAFLGISGTDVTEEVSMTYNLPLGVYVADIVADTGAEAAGLQQGDIIVAFDGENITHMTQLQELLEYYAAGTSVEVTIMRQSDMGYQEKVITVTLGYRTE